MRLKAVLFDATDTLFRMRGSVGRVYASVAARHGVRVGATDIEPRFRAAFHAMPVLAFPGVPESALPDCERAWWKRVVAATFDGHRFSDFDAFFADVFQEFAGTRNWQLFSDTVPALTALRARGLQLAIVSNFDGRLTQICDGLGLRNLFETIVLSTRAGYAKPDPAIFQAAVQRLGVRCSEALHVGDSELEDLVGARNAGLQSLLIVRNGALQGSVNLLTDLRELADRIHS